MGRVARVAAAGTLLAAVGLAASLLGGCASYANVPGPDRSVALRDPNERNAREVMAVAIRTVVDRHPAGRPGQAFAVGLPVGMNEKSAGEVLMAVGPEAVRAPVAGLPTYYIGRVWIRSGFAKVDVLRPVVELGRGADGQYPYQLLTVWQEGGLAPWKATRLQRWGVGSYPRDAIYFIPPELLGTMAPAGDDPGQSEGGGAAPGAMGTPAERGAEPGVETSRAEEPTRESVREAGREPVRGRERFVAVPVAPAEPNPYRREVPAGARTAGGSGSSGVDSGRMLDAAPMHDGWLTEVREPAPVSAAWTAPTPVETDAGEREPAGFDPFDVGDDGEGLPALPENQKPAARSIRASVQAVVVEPL
jgi:hypothetical protein